MPCSTRYRAVNHSGPRDMSTVKWIVLHSTEGSTAAGAASWFANPASGGSTQLVVDDKECYRTLPDDYIPWGAKGANTNGLHMEHAGYASWTNVIWKKHRDMLKKSAWHVAKWCRAYDIPVKRLRRRNLLNGERGITGHSNVNKAFPSSGHTDPGKGFPWLLYMTYVRRAKRRQKQQADGGR